MKWLGAKHLNWRQRAAKQKAARVCMLPRLPAKRGAEKVAFDRRSCAVTVSDSL